MPQYPLNRTYRALFTEFNHRFFDGRLPNYRVVVVPCIIADSWLHGKIYRQRRLIKILERPDHDDMASILIHEMAHAATTDAHGPRFYAEMQRLQQMGAPVQDYEFNPLPRPTKALVRATAEDALTDVPQLTLRQFVRGYARDNGLPAAVLLRRYRWIPATFLTVKAKRKKDRQEVRAALRACERDLAACIRKGETGPLLEALRVKVQFLRQIGEQT